jgi:hypothetical protein
MAKLIENAKMLLKCLRLWSVRHVKRDKNMTGHRLAKMAIHQSMKQIWMEDYPVSIHDIIFAEKVMLII